MLYYAVLSSGSTVLAYSHATCSFMVCGILVRGLAQQPSRTMSLRR